MNARDKVARDNDIIRAKLRGRSWSSITEEFGVSRDTGERAWREWRETNPTLQQADPIEVVDELLVELRGMAEQLAEVAEKAEKADSHSNVIGAVNARRAVLHDMTDLLQATGTLPNDLGTLHHVLDGRVMADQIMGVLERFEAPVEMMREMMIALGAPEDDVPALPPGDG